MIKWGIIGAGHIAQRFAKSLIHSNQGKLYAVASHTDTKLGLFKEEYPGISTYTDYMQLLEDENVDVVYIALRHKDHYKWSKEALLHKKAVLCEKPATLTVEEIIDLKKTSIESQTFFMEGIKTRFIPVIQELKRILEEEKIGKILTIGNRLCYDIGDTKETRYLYDPEQGGILNDVGSYVLGSIIDYIHAPLKEIKAQARYEHGVDIHDYVTLSFGDYQSASFEIAMDENKQATMTICGTHGMIICCPFYRPETIEVKVNREDAYTITKPYIHDDFYTEIEEVHRCIKEGLIESPRMTLDDSIKCASITNAIRKEINDNEV